MKLKTETVQCLLNEARYLDTKPQKSHDMRIWACGTTSCAVGDIAGRGELGLHLHRNLGDMPSRRLFPTLWGVGVGMEAVAVAMQISEAYAHFLFNSYSYRREISRHSETPAQTAARIRKFVYYFLRKSEILADYEESRHREGNWMVSESVKAAV